MKYDIDNCCSRHKTERENAAGFWKAVSGALLVTLVLFAVYTAGSGDADVEKAQMQDTADEVAQSNASAKPSFFERVIPSGVPRVYGAELGVAYDDITPDDPMSADEAIDKVAELDRDITLSDDDRERYINILFTMHDGISCEYCCGARSVIFSDGSPACGCEHSFAMRGLAKYLITEHGDAFSDTEIAEEIGKWKTLFFPDIHLQKANVMFEKGVEVDHVSLTFNSNRGIEDRVSGGMVGDC